MNFVMAGTPLSRSVCSGTIGPDFSRVWHIFQHFNHSEDGSSCPNVVGLKFYFVKTALFGRFCKTRTLRIPSLFGFGDHSGHYDIISKKLKKLVISRFLVFEWFFCNRKCSKFSAVKTLQNDTWPFFKYEKSRFLTFF